MSASEARAGRDRRTLPAWALPLALLALAAALRLSTLDLQSLWFDEAFTPTHVLHRSLGATLRTMAHTENTPPLYYVLLWAWTRLFDDGAIALRSLSAIIGIGTVATAWFIGLELGSRRIATTLAALVAVGPLFVWYSQEARAYGLLILFGALSYLFFERARRQPLQRPLLLWALGSALALLTHYFAIFLVAPEAALLLYRVRGSRVALRPVLLAVGAVGVVGAALLPLILSQGGHGTEWIAQGHLGRRLIAIPQYYVLGPSGGPLGHGLVLLGGLLVGASLLLWARLARGEQDTVLVAVALAACAIAVPLVLALGGADYLAPRNVIAAFVPLTAAAALLLGAEGAGRPGAILAALICLAALAVTIDVDLSPRLQRGDWRDLAHALPATSQARVIVTPELGAAPLEYYVAHLRKLADAAPAESVGEIDLVGYSPIRAAPQRPPVAGFQLVARRSIHGLLLYRFVAASPVPVTVGALAGKRLTAVTTQVLMARGEV